MRTYRYTGILARQSNRHVAVTFSASPSDILDFASIDRAGRTENGEFVGFQRHQVASHIHEIRDYLAQDDAVLPNPIVLAFIDGIRIETVEGNVVKVEITVGDDRPGFVVDGQQRLSALAGLPAKDFEVFVSALVCHDYNELRQQFILINNTRPLPKSLIYELLPTVSGLPEKFTARQLAAKITEQLNYRPDSSLHGMIRLHTNPAGFISDSAIQKIAMQSASDGALRLWLTEPDPVTKAVRFISEFFAAVREVFAEDWTGHRPRTSRLVHGAGMVALGYVMEYLHTRYGALAREEFKEGLRPLMGRTAWTSGVWPFSDTDRREWNKVQNVPNDILTLAYHLLKTVKDNSRELLNDVA